MQQRIVGNDQTACDQRFDQLEGGDANNEEEHSKSLSNMWTIQIPNDQALQPNEPINDDVSKTKWLESP